MKAFTALQFTVVLLLSAAAHGGDAARKDETGIVYGKNFVYSVTAPSGWVLGSESAAESGAHAVFYPKGGSWKESKVVAYATARTRTAELQTADSLAKHTVAEGRAKGSPELQARFGKTLQTEAGKEVQIYFFMGDKAGNFEAVAYVEEAKTINVLVLTSRQEALFREALPAFMKLAQSYRFVADEVPASKAPAAPAPSADPAPNAAPHF